MSSRLRNTVRKHLIIIKAEVIFIFHLINNQKEDDKDKII